jgi:uncharacterized membrane protein YphA (DoxX/SURF4 family)
MIRRLARVFLGAAFINSGLESLRDVDRRADRAASYGLPGPMNPSLTVAAAAQLGAGFLLISNKLPRLAALVAALTVVPDAVTGHDFWSEKDPVAKEAQRSLFARDLGVMGGLLVSAVETGGRESVPHRAVRTSKRAARAAVDKVPVG